MASLFLEILQHFLITRQTHYHLCKISRGGKANHEKYHPRDSHLNTKEVYCCSTQSVEYFQSPNLKRKANSVQLRRQKSKLTVGATGHITCAIWMWFQLFFVSITLSCCAVASVFSRWKNIENNGQRIDSIGPHESHLDRQFSNYSRVAFENFLRFLIDPVASCADICQEKLKILWSCWFWTLQFSRTHSCMWFSEGGKHRKTAKTSQSVRNK